MKKGVRQMFKKELCSIVKRSAALVVMVIMLVTGAVTVNASRATKNDSENAAFAGGMEGYYRKPISQGAQNALLRARQMYEVEWTPLRNMSMYDTQEETDKQFIAGITYKGIPYGQPVHQGVYVGQTATIEEFIEASKDINSKFYTERGLNTWYYDEGAGDGKIRSGPYMASDCSSFVSYCWMLDHRTTTASMEADPERFIVLGKDYQVIEPGMAINKGGVHVILIYDVIYDKDGKVAGITTIEQTPPIMTVRSYGVGGTTGSLADFQAKLDNGYDIIRYRDIEKVKYEKIDGVDKNRSFVSGVEYPISDVQVDKAASGTTIIAKNAESVEIKGWFFHVEPVLKFTVSVNGGPEQTLESEKREGYGERNTLYYEFENYENDNYYSGTVNADFDGEAEAVVYGTTNSGKIEIARIKLIKKNIFGAKYKYESFMDSGIMDVEDSVMYEKRIISGKSEMVLEYRGWTMCSENIIRFEMRVDDGPWTEISSDFRDDVYSKKKTIYKNCRNLNSYMGTVDFSYLDQYEKHTIAIRGVTVDNDVFDVARWEFENANTDPKIIAAWAVGGAGVVAAAVVTGVVIAQNAKKRKMKKAAENKGEPETELLSENPSANEAEDATT